VSAHSLHCFRLSGPLDLLSHRAFALSEAVTNHPIAERLFLPDWNAYVSGRESLARAVEEHDVAMGISAKPVGSGSNALQGHFREQRFDRQEVDGCGVCAAYLAGLVRCHTVGRAEATAIFHAASINPEEGYRVKRAGCLPVSPQRDRSVASGVRTRGTMRCTSHVSQR
jgi:hypothetical protein